MSACYCLCDANHPTVNGCCTGSAVTVVRLDSPVTGPVDVAMCLSCAVAAEAAKDGVERR